MFCVRICMECTMVRTSDDCPVMTDSVDRWALHYDISLFWDVTHKLGFVMSVSVFPPVNTLLSCYEFNIPYIYVYHFTIQCFTDNHYFRHKSLNDNNWPYMEVTKAKLRDKAILIVLFNKLISSWLIYPLLSQVMSQHLTLSLHKRRMLQSNCYHF